LHTLTADELIRQPQQLIDDARRGHSAVVTVAGEPVLMTVPLGKGLDSRPMLVDLAATLYDREQISVGRAAQIAGLSYREMVDELGRREIAVIRLERGSLERELAAITPPEYSPPVQSAPTSRSRSG
jgi:predicted HTH domain antitoxin